MKTQVVTPPAAGILESISSLGYSMESSVADLVDNSIAAGATRVDIDLTWDGVATWLSVMDDGHGMTEEQLVEAMIPAGMWGVERSSTDLGYFGMGLKSASFAHAWLLTVTTSTDGETWHTRTWDRDMVARENRWVLIDGNKPESGAVLNQLRSTMDGPGTVVLWQNLAEYQGTTPSDTKAKRQWGKIGETISRHLGSTFHRFLTGHRHKVRKVDMFVNGALVLPWDPFMESDMATVVLPAEEYRLANHLVTVTGYVLPSPHRMSDTERKAAGGERGWMQSQGLYVYRRNRLISAGGWYRMSSPQERFQQARIAVEIPAGTDGLWDLNVIKSKASPPLELKPTLQRVVDATMQKAAETSRRRVRASGTRKHRRIEYAWTLDRSDGAVTCTINREHSIVQALLETLEEDQGARVMAVLRLLEEGLPLQGLQTMFQIEAGDVPEPFENTPAKDDDSEDVARELYDLLIRQGKTSEQARKKISRTSPFNTMRGFWNQDEGAPDQHD